jgi:MFS family permease
MPLPDTMEHKDDEADAVPGWAALLSGRNAVRSLTLAGGVALHATNVFIATTIMPSVVKDIGGLPYYAWNTTAFIVASILGSSLSTRLLQIAGPRGAYAFAALLFALGTLLCAIAPSMPVFLVGRSLQGFGGGLLLAFAYAMIRLVFHESLWPRAITIVSGMWGAATLVGPAIGGAFAELGAWRWAFWTLIPLSVLFALLARIVLPKAGADRRANAAPPVIQLALLVAAVIALSAGSVAHDRIWNVAGIGGALVFLALLILAERRGAVRLFPADALSPFGRLFALYATMWLLEIAVTPGEVFAPLFFQVLHGQSPLVAGYLAALIGGGWTVGSIMSSGASGREDVRYIVASPVFTFAGMATLAILVPPASGGSWVVLVPICGALICVGFGIGIGWPHLLTRVLKTVRPGEQDTASASLTTLQLLATALGAAMAGMVANLAGFADPGGVIGISHAARWLLTGFALAPALAIMMARRGTSGRT